VAIGAHLEWLIDQRTGAIRDNMEITFQTVLNKLDNLTRKVDKMALEEVALHKAYHQSTAIQNSPGEPSPQAKSTSPSIAPPPRKPLAQMASHLPASVKPMPQSQSTSTTSMPP
jgi:hypothetical protein